MTAAEQQRESKGDKMTLKAPFPYFGGKSRVADDVWERFGEPQNYIEPFCGSLAMLLKAPKPVRVETVNDADGFVANFWRAIKNDPESVAHWADYPVSEIDLEARHAWLVNRSERLRWSLEDPDYYDAKIAGWWVWGLCAWIGSGWCSGLGPHTHNGAEFLKRDGAGTHRQLPYLGTSGSSGRGIHRQLPFMGGMGNTGKGVFSGRNHEPTRHAFILDWLEQLSQRIRDVRIVCGDWERVVKSKSVTTSQGLTAVFLDPPYAEANMDYAAGGVGTGLSARVARWALERGEDPLMRIALCGNIDEHELEAHGWTPWIWKKNPGMAQNGRATQECIWFSPHCVSAQTEML